MMPFCKIIKKIWYSVLAVGAIAVDGLDSVSIYSLYIDGLVQERRNPGALAMELRLSCINPLI